MSATTQKLSRRTMLTGASVLAAAPVLSLSTASFAASGASTIAQLWGEAEALQNKLAAYDAHADVGGLPQWMRKEGEVNQLGNRRHDVLVSILREKPKSNEDLAIMGRVVMDYGMRHGSRIWAADQLALAAIEFAGRNVA